MSTTPKPKFTREHIALATGSALDHIADSFGIHRTNGLINPSLSDDESLRARIINRLNQAETEQHLKERFGYVFWDLAKDVWDAPRRDHLSRQYSGKEMTRDDFNYLYLCHPEPDQSFIGQVKREDIAEAQVDIDTEEMAHRMRAAKEQQERNLATEFGRFLVYVMGAVDPSVKLSASQVRLAEDLFIRVQREGVKPWQF